ncbi:hypothetical protein ACTXT7_016311 [Hymenolepis weldensis]
MVSKLSSGVGDNCSLFNLTKREDENVHHYVSLRSPCYAEIRLRLLSLLDKEPDVKKSRCGPQSAAAPLIANVHTERT